MQSSESSSATVRLTVDLPRKVWDVVVRLATEQSVSKTEVIRRAISAEAFRHDVVRGGCKVLIEHPNGTVERVRFPYGETEPSRSEPKLETLSYGIMGAAGRLLLSLFIGKRAWK